MRARIETYLKNKAVPFWTILGDNHGIYEDYDGREYSVYVDDTNQIVDTGVKHR